VLLGAGFPAFAAALVEERRVGPRFLLVDKLPVLLDEEDAWTLPGAASGGGGAAAIARGERRGAVTGFPAFPPLRR